MKKRAFLAIAKGEQVLRQWSKNSYQALKKSFKGIIKSPNIANIGGLFWSMAHLSLVASLMAIYFTGKLLIEGIKLFVWRRGQTN